LSSAGYETHISGSDAPVVKYELATPNIEVEFLAPEVGRPGKSAISVQHGLVAQTLRYLQIVLENTKEIEIKDVVSDCDFYIVVRIPSPGAFVYQKGLALPYRHSDKVPKDLYYIFDLLDSSKAFRDSILLEIRSLHSQYAPKWFPSFTRNLNKYFPESGAEGPAMVATQYSGSMPIETFRNYAHRTFRDFIQALEGVAAE